MARILFVADLRRAGIVSADEIRQAAYIYLCGSRDALFSFASGHAINVGAAVRRNKSIVAALVDPTVPVRRQHILVQTAISLAPTLHPSEKTSISAKLDSMSDTDVFLITEIISESHSTTNICHEKSEPLDECEQRVLAALREDFVCTTVVKLRARYSCTMTNGKIFDACNELYRRGLAERIGSTHRSNIRWRRLIT